MKKTLKLGARGAEPELKRADFAGLFQRECSIPDEHAELLDLLNPVFPQPGVGESGQHYFEPGEVREFDALFARFGLRFRSSDDKFDDLDYVSELWSRLSGEFGAYIKIFLSSRPLYEMRVKKWPPGFREYIEAVIANDLPTARRLAITLDIENLEALMMPSLFGGPGVRV